MKKIETKVYKESWKVEKRLSELGLNKAGLDRVRIIALSASAEATIFHPVNAAGTFSYQQGTWALRDEFVGEEWKVDRTDGVEAISNEILKVKIIFTNVDLACDDLQEPKPRSQKGAGAERACVGNLFGFLPAYSNRQNSEYTTYYYMLDADGSAELTSPVIKGNTFSTYIERIYLGNLEDVDLFTKNIENDRAVDIEPIVQRK